MKSLSKLCDTFERTSTFEPFKNTCKVYHRRPVHWHSVHSMHCILLKDDESGQRQKVSNGLIIWWRSFKINLLESHYNFKKKKNIWYTNCNIQGLHCRPFIYPFIILIHSIVGKWCEIQHQLNKSHTYKILDLVQKKRNFFTL